MSTDNGNPLRTVSQHEWETLKRERDDAVKNLRKTAQQMDDAAKRVERLEKEREDTKELRAAHERLVADYAELSKLETAARLRVDALLADNTRLELARRAAHAGARAMQRFLCEVLGVGGAPEPVFVKHVEEGGEYIAVPAAMKCEDGEWRRVFVYTPTGRVTKRTTAEASENEVVSRLFVREVGNFEERMVRVDL